MKPKSRPPDYFSGTMSVGQLARRWDVSVGEVRRRLAARALDFTWIQGKIRIAVGDVRRYEQTRRESDDAR